MGDLDTTKIGFKDCASVVSLESGHYIFADKKLEKCSPEVDRILSEACSLRTENAKLRELLLRCRGYVDDYRNTELLYKIDTVLGEWE